MQPILILAPRGRDAEVIERLLHAHSVAARVCPDLAGVARKKFGVLVTILDRKYGFDDFNDWFFAGGARKVGQGLWKWGDRNIIDGIMVNGTARLIGAFAGFARRMQTGYIYTYAFSMILGVAAFLTFFLFFVKKL